MPALHLTDKALRSLSTEKVQEHFSDLSFPGFRVCVGKGGRKTFELVYRSPNPRSRPARERPQRRLTLGSFPEMSLAEARDRAREAKVEIARGVDPQGPRDERDMVPAPRVEAGTCSWPEQERLEAVLGPGEIHPGTFAHLAAEYLVRHAWPNKKRTRDDEGMLRRDLVPAWRDRPAAEIRKRDVVLLVDGIVDRGAVISARRVRTMVSMLFNFGIGRDLVEHNPTAGTVAPGQERRRDRWLSQSEIASLWVELERRRPVMAAVFKTILLTLQRPGEVCTMEWQHLDQDWWTIPGSLTKNGREHRVYLAPPVQELLRAMHAINGERRWVLASWKVEDRPTLCLNRVGVSICRELGFHFTPHDLRRTGATHLSRLGFADEVIERILNHNRPGMIGIYNRYECEAEKKEALSAWAVEVGRICAPAAGR